MAVLADNNLLTPKLLALGARNDRASPRRTRYLPIAILTAVYRHNIKFPMISKTNMEASSIPREALAYIDFQCKAVPERPGRLRCNL